MTTKSPHGSPNDKPASHDWLGYNNCCSVDPISGNTVSWSADHPTGSGAHDVASLPARCRSQRAGSRLGNCLRLRNAATLKLFELLCREGGHGCPPYVRNWGRSLRNADMAPKTSRSLEFLAPPTPANAAALCTVHDANRRNSKGPRSRDLPRGRCGTGAGPRASGYIRRHEAALAVGRVADKEEPNRRLSVLLVTAHRRLVLPDCRTLRKSVGMNRTRRRNSKGPRSRDLPRGRCGTGAGPRASGYIRRHEAALAVGRVADKEEPNRRLSVLLVTAHRRLVLPDCRTLRKSVGMNRTRKTTRTPLGTCGNPAGNNSPVETLNRSAGTRGLPPWFHPGPTARPSVLRPRPRRGPCFLRPLDRPWH